MIKFIKGILFVLLLLLFNNSFAQDRIRQIETQLKSMTTDVPGLEENVQLSVSGVSIQEFMRGIADAHKLNISVDPTIEQNIVNNFANATVSDVLLFVCREYNLKIKFIGSIMSIVKYEVPKPIEIETPRKQLSIDYNQSTNELTLDLKNDSIDAVVKMITQKSKKNVVLAEGVSPKLVSVYIENMSFDNALEKLGLANGLTIKENEDNSYLIEKPVIATTTPPQNNRSPRGGRNTNSSGANNTENSEMTFEAKSNTDISVYGKDLPINEVITTIAKEIGINYFFVSEITDKATVNVTSTNFNSLLDNMFKGTELTYHLEGGIYIIGERKTEGLRLTKVIQLQHRSVETISENIPTDIKAEVDVKEFLDLNSLILSGSELRIQEIEQFIKTIDKVVPMILIEVMIVDYNNNRSNTTGIEAGLGTEPAGPTTGIIIPGPSTGIEPNVSLNSSSINTLIESFNGQGILNLGKVTPNFYLNIRALETSGVLRVTSTPKLAALNGQEATSSVGETSFYRNETSTSNLGVSTQTINTVQFVPLSAELAVTIKPVVSGDDQVTLTITVAQSDFVGEAEPGAPRGTVSRNFTSVIRVKDQEMVLLGGLEQKSINESGRGVPFLSRIPIIKWFFSSRSRDKSKGKLNVFIKPTVIY